MFSSHPSSCQSIHHLLTLHVALQYKVIRVYSKITLKHSLTILKHPNPEPLEEEESITEVFESECRECLHLVSMGKKRRASDSLSRSVTKKISGEISEFHQESKRGASLLLEPSNVDSGGKLKENGNDIDSVTVEPACSDEYQLIESTMIEILLQRGPEKTC